MSCDVGEVMERLENEQLILQPFCHFAYITTHSPTLLSLYLHHRSFSNPSVALPTSQIILQPFRFFTNVTAHSPTLLPLLLRHRLFIYVTWRTAHAVGNIKFKGNNAPTRRVNGHYEQHVYTYCSY